MRVYIAGPYTTPDPVENTRKAIVAGEDVRAHGHLPFVPHLNLLWHFIFAHEPAYWLLMDLGWLALCEALIRLPGVSPGADREEAEAHRLGIPVYYSVEEFLEANPLT